jgi:methionine synthase II (cobalamin-independent)
VALTDPFLAREREATTPVAALRELPDGVPYLLQLPFGDASAVLAALAEAPVDAIGVDFYATPLESVPDAYPKEIAAGIIDARSSALENPEDVAAFCEELVRREPGGLSLTVNGDLQFVPAPIAREKLARLGRARAAVPEEVSA